MSVYAVATELGYDKERLLTALSTLQSVDVVLNTSSQILESLQ